ncbi:MAG: S8 family serine peptidase, partial [Caldilineaceae bacterium]
LDTAVNNSINAGVTFAVAAGNSNAVACNYSPARVANALTVGATTNVDARSSFSNYGTCVDLFAPGSAITSAWFTNASATAVLNGTSMASPHVAGAAALYLQTNPGASPATVRQALVTNATSGRVTNAGTGSPNLLLFTGFIGAAPSTPTATPVAPSPTPTRTPIPPTATPRPTATPVPVLCSQRLANGGFESGRTVWAESSAQGYALICSGADCGVAQASPRTGAWLAWLGGANSETAELRQTLTLPAGQPATLTYQYWVNSTDYCGYDYGYSRLIDGATTVQLRRYSLCTTANTGGWRADTISLNAYAGKTVTLVFRATTDSSYVSDLFVDDVSVQSGVNCVAAADVNAAALPYDVPEGSQPGKPVEPESRSAR